MLSLRIVQAKFGDCFIVIYGTQENPKYILIDGGPGGVYKNYLRPELQRIKEAGGDLELMVLSHVDGDHIVGLMQFTQELREQQADEETPLIEIKELWMNSFGNTIGKGNALTNAVQSLFSKVNNIQSTMPEGDLAFQSIGQGDSLRRNALLLGIPINQIVDNKTITNETVPEAVVMDNISLKIIGPNTENLENLKEEWEKWIKKNESKIMMADAEVMANADRSVPNLSSIMFLLEAEGKTILFTGDGRGDFILEGLEKAGLMNEEGKIHVDIFKVPHHGSIRNATQDFFDKVTADTYILSGDGHHGNPELGTIQWIVEAAKKQDRTIELICTNKTKETEELEANFPPEDFTYSITYLDKESNTSMDIDLIS